MLPLKLNFSKRIQKLIFLMLFAGFFYPSASFSQGAGFISFSHSFPSASPVSNSKNILIVSQAFIASASTEAISLDTFSFVIQGLTSSVGTVFDTIGIFKDNDSDALWDASDSQIFEFSPSSGTSIITVSGFQVPAGSTISILITANLRGGAAQGETFTIQSNIEASGVVSLGTIPISGTPFTSETFTLFPPPQPSSAFFAISKDVGQILLSWKRSPDTVFRYNIYVGDSLGNPPDFQIPVTQVNANAVNVFYSKILNFAVGETRTFGIRAEDDSGVEEDNSENLISVHSVTTAFSCPVIIQSTLRGAKIFGTRIGLIAEVFDTSVCSLSSIANVLYQYRRTPTSAWTDFLPINLAFSDTSVQPFMMFSDISGFSTGPLFVRAIPTLKSDSSVDPSPSEFRLNIVSSNTLSNYQMSQEAFSQTILKIPIFRSVLKTARITGTGGGGGILRRGGLKVFIPANSIDQDSGILTLKVQNSSVVLAASSAPDLRDVGEIRLISVSTGASQFSESAVVTIFYTDIDKDGFLDGTTIRPEEISVYSFDALTKKWGKLSGRVLDKENQSVSGLTSHFSEFGLFADTIPRPPLRFNGGGICVLTQMGLPHGVLNSLRRFRENLFSYPGTRLFVKKYYRKKIFP